MKPIKQNKMFGGVQATWTHSSTACKCDMTVATFVPDGAENAPVLVWLSGLTCNTENFQTKAGAQRLAAELGIILVMPDTSPRGDDVPDKDTYDFGKGAGFYVDATQMPWARNYKMETYIRDELTAWIESTLPADMSRMGIFGHSMGGHGALTLHLKNPDLYKTCSAFAPIVAPSQVPWGQGALKGYLGEDESTWRAYDATELVSQGSSEAHILIDQGQADEFLKEHLRPEIFEKACAEANQKLTLRMQAGYDHSYFTIATFIEDHLRHHAKAM